MVIFTYIGLKNRPFITTFWNGHPVAMDRPRKSGSLPGGGGDVSADAAAERLLAPEPLRRGGPPESGDGVGSL